MRTGVFGALVLGVLATACSNSKHPNRQERAPQASRNRDPAASEPARVEPGVEPGREEAPAHPTMRAMHNRYDAIDVIRRSLIRGEIAAAQATAATLGPVTLDLPDHALPMKDAIPQAAAAMKEAEGIKEVSAAFGRLVAACGNCHRATESSWVWEDPPMPDEQTLAAHMQRHQWGVDRMWEALLVSFPERFDQGARVFAEAPLLADQEHTSEVEQLASAVHASAAKAAEATSMERRAAIFGEILASCAQCHRHFQELDRLGVD